MSADPTRKMHESPETYAMHDGVVLLTDGATLVVRTEAGDVRAQRALSCLVEPVARDRVLCAVQANTAFVLAVLARDKSGPIAITSDEPIEIVSRNGDVSLMGAAGVGIMSGREVSVVAPSITVSATRGEIAIDDVGFIGRVAAVSVGILRTTAEKMERTAERLIERFGRSYRFVEGTESVRARDVDLRADSTMTARAENTVLMARKVVKVDGTQIHMG